ncbi:hypothetical protein [Hafnia paralvei]|uniref:hypothetical protein n=1 Tax=Hafnia paralvei TaxID=546367 RepID=UPI0038D0E3AD
MAGSEIVIEKQASSLIEFGWTIKNSLSKYIRNDDKKIIANQKMSIALKIF